MTPEQSIVHYAARLGAFLGQLDPPGDRPGQPSPSLGEEAFNSLALDLFELQLKLNPVYARYCRSRIRHSVSLWTEIPLLPVAAFKELEVTCLKPGESSRVFYSSGTTAQNCSRHFHHPDSLALYEASLWSWFQARCGPGLAGHRLIFLSPSPAEAPHSSLVHMFETIRLRSGSVGASFAGRRSAATGTWRVDTGALCALLRSAVDSGQPVGLLGTSFHFVHLTEALAGWNQRLILPPDSWVLETGGYKGRSRSVPKSELRASITERLGIPPSRIVGEYGMCELSSQAYDRRLPVGGENSRALADDPVFRFPPWARIRIIDPETDQQAAAGQAGLLGVWDLANAWSVAALQTEDLAVAAGDGFVLLGRAAQAGPRGCSLQSD